MGSPRLLRRPTFSRGFVGEWILWPGECGNMLTEGFAVLDGGMCLVLNLGRG